jgi:hypothetical protein
MNTPNQNPPMNEALKQEPDWKLFNAAFERIERLEQFQQNLQKLPAQKKFQELMDEIMRQQDHAEHLEKKISVLKEERQEAILRAEGIERAGAEHAKRADENWEIVKRQDSKISELLAELDSLKADNRFQRGHSAGFFEAIERVQAAILKLQV